jgi:hypothetical protein
MPGMGGRSRAMEDAGLGHSDTDVARVLLTVIEKEPEAVERALA